MDVPADQGGVVLQPPERFPEGGVLARRVLGQPQAEHQGRELLAHLVVQLAGDPPPLVLLDRHDPPEQLLADLLLPPEGRERLRQRGRPLADPQVQLVAGPADLLLGPLLVRDVEDRADVPEVRAIRREPRGGRVDDPPVGAVVPPEPVLHAERLVPRVRGPEGRAGLLAVVGVDRVQPAEVEALLRGRAGEIAPPLVHVAAGPRGVRDPDHHRGVVGHVAEAGLALPQRRLGLRPLDPVGGLAGQRGRGCAGPARRGIAGSGSGWTACRRAGPTG